MKRKMLLMFVLVTAGMFIAGNVFAGWTQGKGKAYNQLTFSHYKTTSKKTSIEKDSSDNIIRTNAPVYGTEEEEFSSTKLSYYGEFGLLDSLTGIVSGGWDYVRSNDILAHQGGEGDSNSGVGDIILGLRQKISDKVAGGPLSVQLDIKVPEAYEYENPVEFQNLGDGQYDATLKLLLGHGFSKGYAVIGAGYKYRAENDQLGDANFKPADQFVLGLSGGFNAASWLSIRGVLDWGRTVGNAKVSKELIAYASCCGVKKDRGEATLILDTLGLEKSSLSAGVSLAFTLSKKIQTVLSYNTDLDGFGEFKTENASIGETFSLALVYMH